MSAIQYIISILPNVSKEIFNEKILPLYMPMLKDSVFQIRNDALVSLSQIRSVLGDEWFCGNSENRGML